MVHVVHPRVWPAVLSAVSVTPPEGYSVFVVENAVHVHRGVRWDVG
jgi:hypothetical protein